MDRNLLLAVGLSFLFLVVWSRLTAQPEATPPPGANAPVVETPPLPGPAPGAAPAVPAPPAPPPVPQVSRPPGTPEQTWTVETPLYRTQVSSRGAALVGWQLQGFHEGVKRGNAPIQLLADGSGGNARLTTPLLELGLGDLGDASFQLDQAKPLELAFSLTHSGIAVHKQYRFSPEDYSFRLSVEIENQSGRPIQTGFGVAWLAGHQDGPDFHELSLAAMQAGALHAMPIASFGRGGWFSRPQPEVSYPGDVDWAGIQTLYFLAALVPDNPGAARARFASLEVGKRATGELAFADTALPAGSKASHEFRGYFGPKEERRLEAFGSSVERSLYTSWAWLIPLAKFFGAVLQALYWVIPNYGVAIILITVLVRITTLPLTNRQMRSMERMRSLAPKLEELQKKFADDRQKLAEAQMELYRREKVSPLGGCLPMVLQLPVLFGLYGALRSAIELRQAPFVAWIDDLSAPEELFTLPGVGIPVRLLPLLMAGTMVLQQKMTPMPSADPAQARMMSTMMPIMMLFMFYQVPSGLVLYWTVSSILAIAHQRWVGRNLNPSK